MQIANMDEIPLCIDLTPDHTINFKGSKEVIVKYTSKHKARATLVLCYFADGKKLPLMVIFKEQSGNLPQKDQQDKYDSTKIIVKANKKGWMNEAILEEWIEEVC
jgi:hypothetical protein